MTDFEPFLNRLSHYVRMNNGHSDRLAELKAFSTTISAGEEVIEKDGYIDHAFIVSEGWAARQVVLTDGRVQIVNFMLPGDMFDLQVFFSAKADHSVVALTDLTLQAISRNAVLDLFRTGSTLGPALWWATLQEEAILREQVVRNGRRTARERVAHLLVGLYHRAEIAGIASGDRLRLPVTQSDIADCLSLSVVHVNRVLRQLEKEGLICRRGEYMELARREELENMSDYTDTYLHLFSDPNRLNLVAAAE